MTLALALMSWLFTHIEESGTTASARYFASFMPSGMPPFTLKWAIPLSLLYLLEILGQVMRLVSLLVRLYANMLAGHMLILTFIGLMFVLETVILAPLVIPAATAFYLFEVVIVVGIPSLHLRRPLSLHRLGHRARALRNRMFDPGLAQGSTPPSTPARLSRSRSASASVRSAPASALGTSSAR